MLLTGNAAEAVKQSARWPDCMTYHMDNLCFTETSTQHVPTEMKPNAMTVFCRVHSCWHIIGWANSGVIVNQTVTETSVKSFFVHLSHHKDDQWRPYKLWFTLVSSISAVKGFKRKYKHQSDINFSADVMTGRWDEAQFQTKVKVWWFINSTTGEE